MQQDHRHRGMRHERKLRRKHGVSSIIVSSVVSSGICSVVDSVVSVVSVDSGVSSIKTLSGKVRVLSGKNLRGLGGGNGTVGVFNELDSRGGSHASKENQKLHV